MFVSVISLTCGTPGKHPVCKFFSIDLHCYLRSLKDFAEHIFTIEIWPIKILVVIPTVPTVIGRFDVVVGLSASMT